MKSTIIGASALLLFLAATTSVAVPLKAPILQKESSSSSLIQHQFPVATGKEGVIRMLIAYCPTDFSGEGAIVDVDPIHLNWTIVTKVKFPQSEIFGCVADYNPKFDFDPRDPNTLWLDFTSDDAFFLAIDTRFGNTTKLTSRDMFFTGFENFKYSSASNTLQGITGTVTESGYCSDACLGYGVQDVANPSYHRLSTIPFKETADDSSFIDWKNGIFYFQAGYDLRAETCGPHSYSECMLAINMTTGEMMSAIYTPEYDVFKYGRYKFYEPNHNSNVSAFMVGFNDYCTPGRDNSTSYVFGKVDLATAKGYPQACIPQDVVIQTDEWIASYSLDETLLATGSGNGDGDDPQLIVFNTTTGAVVKQSRLKGLASALNAKMGLIFVWALEFVGGLAPSL